MKPFVVTIDVEPTSREVEPSRDAEWLGLRETFEAFGVLRRRLTEHGARTGAAARPVAFAWFIRADPQIAHAHGAANWGMVRYRAELEGLQAQGDTLALHVHAFRWLDQKQGWVTDHADADWVEHAIDLGWRAFRDTWGRRPSSFRFGDRFLTDRVLRQLSGLGVTVDVTIEPGSRPVEGYKPGEDSTGSIPDYRGVPRHPYRPSRRDFRVPGSFRPRPITLLPVSTGCVNAKPVVPGAVEAGHDMVHLNLALDPGWIRGILDAVLVIDPVVVSVVRSGDLVEPRALENLRANLEYLATHPAVSELDFVVPTRAIGPT